MVSKTIFYEKHFALNAKMIDFGGWEMPIHYGSQISEHLNTRKFSSLFDVSHMAVVDVLGPDAYLFLHTLLANNIDKLQNSGQALYTCMLNHEGGIIDDLIVYKIHDFYRLVINASTALSDLIWMQSIAKDFLSVQLVPRRSDLPGCQSPLVLLALQGPQSSDALAKIFPENSQILANIPYFGSHFLKTKFGEFMISRTGYTGEDGFELFLPQPLGLEIWDFLFKNGILPAGLGARDTLRIEAGYNLYGQDMNEALTPFDCGLTWTLDFSNNRKFIGSESLKVYKKVYSFWGLVLQGKGILRSHQTVKTSLGDGEVTSGTFSPSLQKSIAFARLPFEIQSSTVVDVLIREQLIPAKVVKPAFVRRGQILI